MGSERLKFALAVLAVAIVLVVTGVVIVAGVGVALIVFGVLLGAAVLSLVDVGSGDSS